MPLGIPPLLQFLVVLLDARLAVVRKRTSRRLVTSATQEVCFNPRHLPIVLDLIFELRQLLNDRLSFPAFLLVGDVAHSPVEVVNRAGLVRLTVKACSSTQKG